MESNGYSKEIACCRLKYSTVLWQLTGKLFADKLSNTDTQPGNKKLAVKSTQGRLEDIYTYLCL